MSREIDIRYSRENASAVTGAALLPSTDKQRVSVHRLSASGVSAEDRVPETGDFIQRALRHVQSFTPAADAAQRQAPEFVADPSVLETSSGARAVNLQQRYKGIPIFQAAITVRFSSDGSLKETVGTLVTASADVSTRHTLSVQAATLAAAKAVAQPQPGEPERRDQFGEPMPEPSVDVTNFVPKVIASFPNTPEQSAVLEAGPFGDEIKAAMTWFPVGGELKLAWQVLLTFPNYAQQYDVVVDANSGEVLYTHQMVQYVAAALNVYHVDGAAPRQMTNVPLGVAEYGLPLPTTGQDAWRWCHKCQGLHFAGMPDSHCPAGGAHDSAGSFNYLLSMNNPAYPGQSNWRFCHKCKGLCYAGDKTQGVCPAGGSHDATGSSNYRLLGNKALAPGQHGWRWCHKCEALFYGLFPGSVCPAGGAHDGAGSWDYSLTVAGAGPQLPVGFPDTWVTVNKTVGNSTSAHVDESGAPLQGTTVGNLLTFNPANATGDDQKVLNIFYYCCYMHDLSYILGFREADGNFQTDDFGRGGTGSDPVDAQAFKGPVIGTANMSTPVDGSSPVMNMGLVSSTKRHTAFDSSVVFHEYTHGITNRLVGGRMNDKALHDPQSRSMGEGWSDYMACTINNSTVLGNWVLDDPKGIRGFPYDANFPDHFGMLGTGRYAAGPSGQPADPHNVGEIWCAALMEFGRRADKHLVMQLMVDALKLTPSNPSFLEARDAMRFMLAEMRFVNQLDEAQYYGAWQALWSAFAHFGMGPGAQSNGAQLNGIVADFLVGQPDWRWCHKCQGLFFNGATTKGKCPAGGAHDSAGSGNYMIPNSDPTAPGQRNWFWCHKCAGMHFGEHEAQSKCPAGGTHDHAGSGNYILQPNAAGSPGQYEWRWCSKCQGLFFAGNATQGVCPAGGHHDHALSANYSLMQFSQAGQALTAGMGAAA